MSGKLYVVGTPIGNLGDMSPRAVETLKSVHLIAAEDTRVSIKLLNHFEIKKPLVSYHEHNHITAGQAILARLLAGESCALVTDAGTPAVSDPGEDLVRAPKTMWKSCLFPVAVQRSMRWPSAVSPPEDSPSRDSSP